VNRKKYIIASVVVALVAYAFDFIVHVLILADAYKANEALFGSMDQMMKYIWLNPIAYFSLSFALGFIFIKGYENRGIMEGVRFGLLTGILMHVPRFCFEVMYYPYPKIFDVSNLVFGLIIFVILGIVFSLIYKPLPKAA